MSVKACAWESSGKMTRSMALKITIILMFTIIMMKKAILLKPKVVAESIR